MTLTRRDMLRCAAALPLTVWAGKALSQAAFPNSTVKIVVPFAPGGTNDILGRLLAEKMTASAGQSIVVENKSGAGGAVGAQFAARAGNDGHTLLLHSASLVIQQLLSDSAGYDYQQDFTPISLLTQFPLVLVVNPSLPVKNVQEFVDYARSKGNTLFYGSAGPGSSQHLVGELFNRFAGTQMQHVPYRGNAPATAALLAGDIQVFFDIIPTATTLGAAGKVRNLAVTSKTPNDSVPELPSLHESVLPGFEATIWQAMYLPSGASSEVVQYWNRAINAALTDENLKKRLAELGFQSASSTPEALATHMQNEYKKWGKVISDANIKI